MDIEIILEPDVSPQGVAEIAVEAEKLGVRALWTSNYHHNWDAFVSLVPAAQVTSKIYLGALAVSPLEMHPLKIANTLLSVNELSNGRAMVAISGGGGVAGAMGIKMNPKKLKSVGRVRETVEIILAARDGQFHKSYDGEHYQITRPFIMNWATSDGPQIYTCSTEPQMLRMGARLADGLQMSDVAIPMLPKAMENVKIGLGKRDTPAKDFRIGNFWAWHIKKDREKSMHEARRELVFRGSLLPPHSLDHFLPEDEIKIVLDNFPEFQKAYWMRTGVIENVPEHIVNHLIEELSSSGTEDDIPKELNRFRQFADGGLTDLSIRLFDDPMDGLKMIGEHVIPALK